MSDHGGCWQMPKKKNYESRILNRANELARSGRYKGWLHLAIDLQVLHSEPLASQVLDREPIRSDLNQLCTEARKRNQEERHAPWTKEPEKTG